jgi:hypothetical protein
MKEFEYKPLCVVINEEYWCFSCADGNKWLLNDIIFNTDEWYDSDKARVLQTLVCVVCDKELDSYVYGCECGECTKCLIDRIAN